MKYLSIFFCLILSCLSMSVTFAQDYNNYILKADSLYDAKNYLQSGESFESAFKLKKEKDIYRGHYYNAACAFSLAGKKDEAFSLLNKAISAGWLDLSWMKNDPDLSNIRADDRWEAVLEKTQDRINEYEKNFNKPLPYELFIMKESDKLEEQYGEGLSPLHYELFLMRDADQVLRGESRIVRKEHGVESQEFAVLWDSIKVVDAQHTNRLKEIIAEHGWPGKSLVGEDGSHAAWLLIQHADLEDQAGILPLLEEAVASEEASKRDYAYLLDRVNMHSYKKQLYGTQVMRVGGGNRVIVPIEKEYLVDKRRADIDLPPLTDYVKRFKIEYELPSEDTYEERIAKEQAKYEDYINQARTAYEEGKYDVATAFYYDAITLRIAKGSDFYETARAFAQLGDTDESFRFLNLALLNGWSSPSKLKKEPAFKVLHQDKRWKAVMERANLSIEK